MWEDFFEIFKLPLLLHFLLQLKAIQYTLSTFRTLNSIFWSLKAIHTIKGLAICSKTLVFNTTLVFHSMLVYLYYIKENTFFIFWITYTINTGKNTENHQIFSYSSSNYKICMLNKITGKEKKPRTYTNRKPVHSSVEAMLN